MVTLLAFVVLGGGAAYAANTIFSADIVNNEVYGADVRDDTLAGGGLGHVDLKAGSVRSSEVGADSLTGADIANKSGVDTCPSATLQFGDICAGGPGVAQNFYLAEAYCRDLELRLPTQGEARALAEHYDVPGVGSADFFWTDELFVHAEDYFAMVVQDDGHQFAARELSPDVSYTVCVTIPTN